MSHGDSEKDKGNAAFYKGDYVAALKHYDKAIENAGSGAVAAIFSNKAAALQKLGQYDLCIQQCKKGLTAPGLTPELKSKIYFRITFAYEALGKFEDALVAMKNCESSPTILEKSSDLMSKLAYSDPAAMRAFCGKLAASARSTGAEPTTLTLLMERLAAEGPGFDPRTVIAQPTADTHPFTPGDNSNPDRRDLIAEHNRALKLFKETITTECGALPVRFDTMTSAAAGDVSTTILYSLKPITIGQMRLDEVNVGKILICRTIAEPMLLNALATLIEDPTGEATRLSVYNLRSTTVNGLMNVLPAATYLAIKEPWYKSAGANGKRAVRVDNPANLVYLEQTHDLLKKVKWRTSAVGTSSLFNVSSPQTWESLEKRGNELFVAGSYELAIAAYNDAIELKRKVAPKEEVADLLASRAAAFLADEKPMDAFWDCTAALNVQPGHLKATLRLAKAHAGLAKFDQAKDVLVKSPHANTKVFQAEIAKLNRRLREQQYGDYDIKALLKEASANDPPRLDHADYNAGVRVQWISKEKGNALVAQQEFDAGDLIFVEKAFAATFASECTTSASASAGTAQSIVYEATHNECVSRIIRRISKNNDLAKQLYRLYAGADFERLKEADKDDGLAVDYKRVAAIVNQNAFCNYSGAETTGSGRTKIHLPGVGYGYAFDGCGVWMLASFVNHSCVPNIFIFYVGDFMFVRAAKRIRKGEELTLSYASLADDYAKRQETLMKNGFNCECELCVFDLLRLGRQPDLDQQRQAFMDSFNIEFISLQEAVRDKEKSIGERTEKLGKLAEQFSSLVAYTNRYDASLSRLYAALGCGYKGQQQYLKAAQAYELAYLALVGSGSQEKATGDTFIKVALPLDALFQCYDITSNAVLGRDFVTAKEYLGKMRQVAKICWGSSDQELAEMLYPEIPIKHLFESLI